MAPKPKPKAGGGGEDETWENFQKIYQKGLRTLNAPRIPDGDKIMEKLEEGMDPEQVRWNFTEPLDKMGFQVLMHSLRAAEYKKITNIRLWKCETGRAGDELVRAVCDYLDGAGNIVQDLQFTDLNITPLGCEFLGRTLGGRERKLGALEIYPPVNYLRLDYNHIGGKGVEKLSIGLAQNKELRALSLQYCAIGADGGQPLANILMYRDSEMEQLLLQGNELKETGMAALLKGVKRNQKLKVLNVADNKFSETQEVVDLLMEIIQNNTLLENYKLIGNKFSDDCVRNNFCTALAMGGHVKEFQLPETLKEETMKTLDEALGKGKKKKGKKGKKK